MVFTFFPQSGRYTAPPHAIPTESCRMADTSQNDIESYKQKAALRALDMVEDGMRIGIGTGSTADYFTRALGNAVRDGLRVIGVATSRRTDALARECGIPLVELDAIDGLDMTIDGADELDPALRLIKGGGGALLREKIVAAASRRLLIIADHSKYVETLGRFALPVEITPFAWRTTARRIRDNLSQFDVGNVAVALRRGGAGDNAPFVTDGGHNIIDCDLQSIGDPEGLAGYLNQIPGVMEHGLFIGMASEAIIAGPDGVTLLQAPRFPGQTGVESSGG